MDSNWSRLKRKLDENKHTNPRNKRRRFSNTNNSFKNAKSSNSRNHNPSKTNNNNNNNNNRSFITKYTNSSSSNSNTLDIEIENYRNNTSRKELFETLCLIPPVSSNNNMEQRKSFWNDLRLKLRARFPKEFLFKLITPLKEQINSNKSHKLHEIKANVKYTNIVGLDCEMVGVGHKGNKSVLARISIVNYYGDAIYDKFVKPKDDPQCMKITDFREEITGITRQDLMKYGISFEQTQKEIIHLLKGRKIIGHAIDNDFAVIKCANILKKNFYGTIITENDRVNTEKLSKRKLKKLQQKKHNESWVFDTAKCQLLHDDLSKPRSLKFLLELYLGIHIQSNSHDSVIDAISTMALYRAILPEIKEERKKKRMEKKEMMDGKKEWLKKKEEEREKREDIRRNVRMMNNYAYNNELDQLLAQFGGRSGGTDNFEKQLLCTNPYKHDNGKKKDDDDDVTSFLE